MNTFKSLEQEEPILQFFAYGDLGTVLQMVAQPFQSMAMQLVLDIPRNPERTIALRHLLDARSAALRARQYRDPNAPPETATEAARRFG